MHRDDEVKDNNGKALSRHVRFEVFPDARAKNGKYGFRMFDSANPGAAVDQLIFSKVGKKKNDYHKITFALENMEGADVMFASSDDALWVVEHPTVRPRCPETRPAQQASGKTLRLKQRHDHDLIVHNNNNEICEFSFALGVVEEKGGRVYALDPGGSNQNGGEDPLVEPGGINANVVIGAVAGAALLALAFVVLR